MEALVSEEIRIKNYTPELRSFFESKLTFDNPEYYKKLNSGRWVGDTPQKISLIKRDGADLILPFGMLPLVFQNRGLFDGIYHAFKAPEKIDYGSTIKPYDYQEEAIKAALRVRQGVIVAPCGSGKTQIGLEIAARIGGRTLWLTHTSDLLNQSMTRAKTYFGLRNSDYGTITGGKVDIGRVITFATVQTMVKIDLQKIKDCFDVIITDEAHHAVGTPTRVMMFYKVLSSLSARYKYGLTATPKRSDGLTECMFALIGPKIHEITGDCVKETTCEVKVNVKKTEYVPDMSRILMSDGTLSYPRFVDDIMRSKERNEMIVEDIANADGTCLVLTERIAHIDLLKKKLEERGVSVLALSAAATKKAKEERETALFALNSKAVKVLIATYQLAKEGLDVPTLDNLFFAIPQKNETVVTQTVGRVARRSDGKSLGLVHDYEDAFPMLKGWQKKRNAIYKKLGCQIEEGQ